jgi:hypothetical protein
MKSGLYRAEVVVSLPVSPTADRTNMPEADECAFITDKDGLFFAKLHPVKVTAEPRTKKNEGCYFCNDLNVRRVCPMVPDIIWKTVPAAYCFNCGKRLTTEEVAEGGV